IQVERRVPGLDIAVSIDGSVVWSEGFGYADLEHQVPVMPGVTKFRIGSVSKSLTATAIGKLVDEGKMDLKKEIQTYVPYFPEKKYNPTIAQVAGHLGGIRHYQQYEEYYQMNHFKSLEASLSIFSEDTLLFEPGSRYRYSSFGYNLLGAAIEGASGLDYLTYMEKEVFAPLEMSNTCADRNSEVILNRTSFYEVDTLGKLINAPYVNNSYKWAGGGFISTTTDLNKFGQSYLEQRILSEETIREFTTAQQLTDGTRTKYGLGWYVEPTGYSHPGGSVGGIAEFKIYEEEKLVIVLLSNLSWMNYEKEVELIAEDFIAADIKME
ncbi:MAG: serine hydrolase domain-containing protein, partial [Ekhidna sp.]|uniref:serine hydrolase domain-containing protein n=1 Tax=Ekhidna sp. TaxID=2608089 RepID=UPI0032978A16